MNPFQSSATRWLAVCFSTVALLAQSAFGAPNSSAAEGPTIEDYAALPSVSLMAISPSGETLAFRANTSGEDTLVVVSLKTGEMLNGLGVNNLQLRRAYFLAEDQLILETSEHRRVLGYRSSFDVSTAFVFSPRSGKLEQLLTPGDNIIVGQTGLGRIVGVSTDLKHVYMPAFASSRRRAVGLVQGGGPEATPNYSLMEVDLARPRRPRTAHSGTIDTIDYFLDSNGELLAEERFNNRANRHSLVYYAEEGPKDLFEVEAPFPQLDVEGLTLDEKALVISDAAQGRLSLSALNLHDGSVEPLFARENADVSRPLMGVNRVVQGVQYGGFRPSYQFFDDELNQRVEAIVAAYPGQSVNLVSWSPDWKHLVIKVEGSASAGDFMLYSQGKEPRFLAEARPTIAAADINPIVEFFYQARDGMKIPALLTVPRAHQESLHKLPAVMLPHGGPAYHDRVGFDWLSQALASQGYLVIQPQFRGSTGFGLAHLNAGRGEWGKKMQDDVTDGLKTLIGEDLVDPDRVCIVGWSYGGYAALAGGAFTPELYQCVASINGVSDLPRMMSTERSQYGRNHWVLSYWEDSIAKGEATRDSLRAVSPARAADNFQAPVLLIHGENDRVVDHDQSRVMRSRLRRANKSVELVTIRNDDHNLHRAESRLETLQHLVTFLDTHIGERD
ncbi:S9 family peptidase [Marinimicrobium sp. ABcell2]|uniref:alpha/beta hydrolase family protein n=1 Tax=Marinimicrobium sp. ABcell2 TaxID=3069751 RepID=UPI0027B03581|nr:alpha/beta fold hydrolase [Marinimicrobium sp. ABcell2]MDQ2076835.1 prolyl oligopeptidase family serine peptidase [Marinimicrobium sp. ABcell2]